MKNRNKIKQKLDTTTFFQQQEKKNAALRTGDLVYSFDRHAFFFLAT
jgi:hypothetical protein